MSFWTEENEKHVTLAGFLREGLSAAQIGERLGTTRNAVIGKVNRDERLRSIGFARQNKKLSEVDVLEIKAFLKAGIVHRIIARKFNVSNSTVHAISAGRFWTWVGQESAS